MVIGLTFLTAGLAKRFIYRKVMYKSRGLCAFFQLFGAASFKCGLYAKF